jgi:hypothetical protein
MSLMSRLAQAERAAGAAGCAHCGGLSAILWLRRVLADPSATCTCAAGRLARYCLLGEGAPVDAA